MTPPLIKVHWTSSEEKITPNIALGESKKAVEIIRRAESCDCFTSSYDFLFTINYLAEKLGYTTQLIINGEVSGILSSSIINYEVLESMVTYRPSFVRVRTRNYIPWLLNIVKSIKKNSVMLIKVYCGQSIEDKAESRHPITEVKKAMELLKSGQSSDCFTNSTDFVFTMKYLGEKLKIPVEFFLDGVSTGSDIEPIFKTFNDGFQLLKNELDDTESDLNILSFS